MVEGGLGTHFTLETVRYLVLIIPEQFGQVKNLQVGGGKASTTDGIVALPFCGLLRGLVTKVIWGDSFPKVFVQRGHLSRAGALL